jgi:peptidoglycan-N-acetylglucosamine deacetylase
MPNPILLDLYPGGKRRALTFTFDDGQVHDRRMVDILNQHSLRATFHLISSNLDRPNFVRADEVKSLYANHEVSGHSVTHPCLTRLAPTQILSEILEDRKTLERLTGQVVRGFAYPYGDFDDHVVSVLQSSGLTYARTTQILPSFTFPSGDFLRLGFSCRHQDADATFEKFLALPNYRSGQAMIVFAHSYEFERPNIGWDNISSFCKRAADQHEKIWFTTLIDLVDYTIARQRAHISADGSIIHNPTTTTLWATIDNQPAQIAPGQTLHIN